MRYADAAFDACMFPLERTALGRIRSQRVGAASGDVLELGAGTGANLRHYDHQAVTSLTLTDLEPGERLSARAADSALSLEVMPADGMQLPFRDGSFHSVVVTLVLCSVPDQADVLAEIRRVLVPNGRLHFVEHVRPGGVLGWLFDRANPCWHSVTGECNLNRDTLAAIRQAGFDVTDFSERARGALIHGEAVSR